MDPHLGRMEAFADDIPDARTYYFLASAYATYFAFPSLGGYDPLVSQKQIEYSFYLDYPNFCSGTLTRDFSRISKPGRSATGSSIRVRRYSSN